MSRYIIYMLFSLLSSYSSMYGFGNYVDDETFITDYSSNYFYFKLNDLSNRGTESVFNISYRAKSSSAPIGKLDNSYLSSFSFLFPVLDSHFFRIGFNPYTNSDILFFDGNYTYIQGDPSLGVSAIAYNTNYQSLGGISKAYIDYSTQLSQNVFIGFGYSYLFGNLEQNKEIKLFDINYSQLEDETNYSVDYTLNDSMVIKKIHNFEGHNIKIESRILFNSSELTVSGAYNFPINVATRLFYNPFINPSNESLGLYDDLEQLESALDANQVIDNKYDGGLKKTMLQYRLGYDDFNYFVFRLSSLNRFNYKTDLMYLPDSNVESIYFAHESYNPNYRTSSFDYINYKIGIFYNFLDNNDYDYGLELNYGITYAENNSIFISLKYGNRSHSFLNFDLEKYCLISFNLENIENWFLKGDY